MAKKIIPPTQSEGGHYILAFREFLKVRELNRNQVAKMCGLSYPTINNLYNGRQKGLDTKTLAKLRNGIGVMLTDIWKWVEE